MPEPLKNKEKNGTPSKRPLEIEGWLQDWNRSVPPRLGRYRRHLEKKQRP